MSEYRCHKCESSHTTENMVSYCASCFAASQERVRVMTEALMECMDLIDDTSEAMLSSVSVERIDDAWNKSKKALSPTPSAPKPDDIIRFTVERSRGAHGVWDADGDWCPEAPKAEGERL